MPRDGWQANGDRGRVLQDGSAVSALERWRRDLAARAIPQHILDAAPASPYTFPKELFRARAERAVERPTTDRAAAAVPPHGTILDVGCGGGATSVGVAARASVIAGVDVSAEMLAMFRETIEGAGVAAPTYQGRWPTIAPAVPAADVVVCGHVLYNVQDLAPFANALTAHARRRVVVELTERHPLAWMNDLWERFHGVRFPDGPSADDAANALGELGLDVSADDRDRDFRGKAGFGRREDAVALIRTRLCLGADRDADVVEALGDRLRQHDGIWSAGPAEQPLVTLWWDGRA
jgi:2-polyprenyl-3-methyl-5-hydroxy-6-metoxy-1,4-benzoquinol methylase